MRIIRYFKFESNLADRLRSGVAWSVLGELSVRAATFLIALFIARFLGVEDYGALVIVQTTLGTFAAFSMLGMGSTACRFIAAYRDNAQERIEGVISATLLYSIASGAIFASLLFFGAEAIAVDVFRVSKVAELLKLIAPVILLSSVAGVLASIIIGFECFRVNTYVQLSCSAVSLLLVVIGTYKLGLAGAVYALIISELFKLLLLIIYTQKTIASLGFRLSIFSKHAEFSVLTKFSIPLVLGSLSHMPAMWVCKAIVSNQPNGLVSLAMFDVAQKLFTLVIAVPMAASSVMNPVLANLSNRSKSVAFRSLVTNTALIQFMIATFLAITVSMLAHWLLLLFGEEFIAAKVTTIVMMLLAPIFLLKHLTWQTLVGTGKAWETFYISITWAILAILLTFLWSEHGATALAMAMLVSYAVTLGISCLIIQLHWNKTTVR